MNVLLQAAKFCQKESLEKLRDFHVDLVAWAAEMQESGTADHDALYASADVYLLFLTELGVLEQIAATVDSGASEGS